jgi:hypothetical protein
MDMNSLDRDLWRLRDLPVPPRPPLTALTRLMQRRRRKRLATMSLLGVFVGLAVAGGVARLSDRDGVTVASDGRATTTTAPADAVPAGSVLVPDVIGWTVSAAADKLDEAGLALLVNDGDAPFAESVVVAAEPGAGATVEVGAVVGVRTALPDPPSQVECPDSRHPRGEADPDALPSVDGLDRQTAEATVLALRDEVPESSTTEIYLGIWDRWGYTGEGAAAQAVPVRGFQAVVTTDDPSGCPRAPQFRGVPVTYIVGSPAAWAGSPVDGAPTPSPASDACEPLSGTELVVGDHALTRVPAGFRPDGEVTESSTGFVDAGGESHAVQRFTNPEGQWIEFDSFGAGSPAAYIADLNADVPSESVTYRRCADLLSGPEMVEHSLIVARHPDRTIVAAQEWEYGGFSISGHPDVAVDDLLTMASGLRIPSG